MRPLIVTALALAAYSSVPAIAQDRARDVAYCERLYGLWSRHLAPFITNARVTRVHQDKAVERCRKGDATAGIAVLEKTLRDNHFTLPPR
jgi:hypothetical protein